MSAESQPHLPGTQDEILMDLQSVDVAALRNETSRVVNNVTWQIRRGDFWVVAGLQGSGKTDLLSTLAGLMPPAAGSYTLFGEPMPIFDEARMATRLRVGMVFESGQLFNHLTVEENLALPLRYHHNRSLSGVRREVEGLLELCGIQDLVHKMPGGLGRNWQKRVGLARALALKPEVLLLDSPLTSLDLRHTAWWLTFLAELAKGHPCCAGGPLTIVVTASDLRPWGGVAKQFAAIRKGRFSILGNWEKLGSVEFDWLGEVLAGHGEAGDEI